MVPKTVIHLHKREDWDGNAPAVPGVRKNRNSLRKIAAGLTISTNMQKRRTYTNVCEAETKYRGFHKDTEGDREHSNQV